MVYGLLHGLKRLTETKPNNISLFNLPKFGYLWPSIIDCESDSRVECLSVAFQMFRLLQSFEQLKTRA